MRRTALRMRDRASGQTLIRMLKASGQLMGAPIAQLHSGQVFFGRTHFRAGPISRGENHARLSSIPGVSCAVASVQADISCPTSSLEFAVDSETVRAATTGRQRHHPQERL